MIQIDKKLLEDLLRQAAASPRLRAAFDLRNSAEDQSQRMMNGLMPGTVVPIHRHRFSSETVVVLNGRLKEIFFDDKGQPLEEFPLDAQEGPYGLNIPKGQWHTVEVTEPCVIMEVKDGPYAPLAPEDSM
ncbi:MAG: WbuC family cupin fold metalloprotein [Bacteroidaceae bacterium]|nr:WbuC family cupin fold metalloprotein [Bacteroidaceae bacterium]